jgi:hypothetical protein
VPHAGHANLRHPFRLDLPCRRGGVPSREWREGLLGPELSPPSTQYKHAIRLFRSDYFGVLAGGEKRLLEEVGAVIRRSVGRSEPLSQKLIRCQIAVFCFFDDVF